MASLGVAACHTGDADSTSKAAGPAAIADTDWPVYGGSARSDRYSELRQIDRANVSQLRIVWRFDMAEPGDSQTSPIVVGGTLYGYTPDLEVIALNAATGALLWKFDAGVRGSGPHRGLTFWTDGKERRLLAGVMNFLYALDPATGNPIESFGDRGHIDLRKDLGRDFTQHYVSLTTPSIVYKDLVIVGFRTSETQPAAPGDVRAYDVHSGVLRWAFHTIPHDGEFGNETWPKDTWKTASAANSWAGFALDETRGIVYVPTGSPASDFYGADRKGNNLFANTLLALDAATGKRLWHFQGVHHDIWDRDFPSAPSLLTVTRDGKRTDAVALGTKQGFIYVFDRVTGRPLFPVEEHAYPASDVPGEKAAPTQPRPLAPKPFARQLLTEDQLTRRTPEAHDWAVEQLRRFRSAGLFVPFNLERPTVVLPGFDARLRTT